MIVPRLNIQWELIGEHSIDAVLISVPDRRLIVPALEFQHIQRFLEAEHFLLNGPLSCLKQRFALWIGRCALGAPGHKLLDVLDLQPGPFQASQAGALPYSSGVVYHAAQQAGDKDDGR